MAPTTNQWVGAAMGGRRLKTLRKDLRGARELGVGWDKTTLKRENERICSKIMNTEGDMVAYIPGYREGSASGWDQRG